MYGFAHIEENGGKGSGNFGHSGRPGLVGGSGDGMGMTIDMFREGFNPDPNHSDEARKGSHPFSNEILFREGVNLDAENDLVYLNNDSHKQRKEKEYDYGRIQFGAKGHKDGQEWSDEFDIEGNIKLNNPSPDLAFSLRHKVYVSTIHRYDDAEYYWAYSDNKRDYTIVRDGKKVESFKTNPPKNSIKDDRVSVPCSLLERITELNKKVKPFMIYD